MNFTLLKKLFFIVSAFTLAINTTSIANPPKKPSISTPTSIEETQTKILNIIANYFVSEKFQEALQKIEQANQASIEENKPKLTPVSEETKTFILESHENIPLILEKSKRFRETPGYEQLLLHLLADSERFSLYLGYGADKIEELKKDLTERSETFKKIIVTSHLEKLDAKGKKLKEKNNNLSPKRSAVRTRVTKSPGSKKISDTEGVKKISPIASPPTKALHASLIDPKKKYLEKLLELSKLSQEYKNFEYPDYGLTLNKYYSDTLDFIKKQINDAQKESDRKKGKIKYAKILKEFSLISPSEALPYVDQENEQITIEESRQETTYDSYALTLRGTLYELEAAVAATEKHDETILAFGAQTSLTFNTGKQAALILDIEKYPSYLHLSGDQNSSARKLVQEYDLVTNHNIIECKCIQGGALKYLPNLLREQYIANIAGQAAKAIVMSGDSPQNPSIIYEKPVTLYVKYTTDKNDPQKFEQEKNIIEHGFSVWNGSTYSFSITKKSMLTGDFLEHIKKIIKNIGSQNCYLYVQNTLGISEKDILDTYTITCKKIVFFEKREYKEQKKHESISSEIESPKKPRGLESSGVTPSMLSLQMPRSSSQPQTETKPRGARKRLTYDPITSIETSLEPEETKDIPGVTRSWTKEEIESRKKETVTSPMEIDETQDYSSYLYPKQGPDSHNSNGDQAMDIN